jgi:hypothetical protein
MQVGKEEPEEGSMVEVEDTDDYLLYLEDILKTVHKVGTVSGTVHYSSFRYYAKIHGYLYRKQYW